VITRALGTELFVAYGRTDAHKDMTKLIIAFRSLVNETKNSYVVICWF
jgi:hypothetical protein